MSVGMDDGNEARILAQHDNIALSSMFTDGEASLKDMTMDSTNTMLYILVNNGMFNFNLPMPIYK